MNQNGTKGDLTFMIMLSSGNRTAEKSFSRMSLEGLANQSRTLPPKIT